MHLENDPLLNEHIKGVPFGKPSIRLCDVGQQGWNVLDEDLPLPLAVLRQDALDANRRWMREFVSLTDAKLAPHGKTTMSPQLFAMQMEDGAWGLTVATMHQVRIARAAGIRRILLANELIGRQETAYVLDELSRDDSFEFYCLVDSLEGVARLASAAAAAQPLRRPLQVFIEMGYPGGRAGCRDIETAVAIAHALKATHPNIALCGVEGYEGLYQAHPGSSDAPEVEAFLQRIVAAAQQINTQQLFATNEPILSAGGSAYYDMVVEILGAARLSRTYTILLRSGCYLTHDAGLYEGHFRRMQQRSALAREVRGGFENALEVWAYVLSVPEPGRAILGAGRRDFGHDAGFPVPIRQFRPSRDTRPAKFSGACDIVAVNDQHAHVVFASENDLQVGDMIALGASHPCTTFDKWALLYVVDERYSVVSAIQTFF